MYYILDVSEEIRNGEDARGGEKIASPRKIKIEAKKKTARLAHAPLPRARRWLAQAVT